jgi:2-dehydro-3-deoxyphosphogalactonate aldolase
LRSGLRTPSEAFRIIAAGADALKLFPSEGSSPAVLKALRAVLPQDLPVIPVGGISEKRLAAEVQAGARSFGIGPRSSAIQDQGSRWWHFGDL